MARSITPALGMSLIVDNGQKTYPASCSAASHTPPYTYRRVITLAGSHNIIRSVSCIRDIS